MSIPRVLLNINKKDRSDIITDVDIILEDGSAAYLYEKEEGVGLILYQDRINAPIDVYNEIWEVLSQGKAFYKDFPEARAITDEMLREAIEWLWCPNEGFSIMEIQDTDQPNLCERINKFLS